MNRELFVTMKEKTKIKEEMKQRYRKDLREQAEECMKQGPWSVSHSAPVFAVGDSHEYHSQAPYWWPDPEDLDGPYVRRDGEFYPNLFLDHKNGLRRMCKSVLILCGAGYYLEDSTYFNKAIELLQVWFLDEATYMKPHLEYAQCIPGICDGRGIGIIDTIYLVEMIEGVLFIPEKPQYSEVISELKEWFRSFLKWMTGSQKGIDEKLNGNNHSTWWMLQAAAYAVFVDDNQIFEETVEYFKQTILVEQVAEDGSFPLELKRTRSYHYTVFNLMPLVMMAELSHQQEEDLWNYSTPKNQSVAKAVRFFEPFIRTPKSWPYPTIDEPFEDLTIATLLIEKRLPYEFSRGSEEREKRMLIKQDVTLSKMMLPLYFWS